MNNLNITAVLLSVAAITLSSSAIAADVGVSLSIGQPGFYGQIDIGDYPQPRTIYRQPVIIERVTNDRQPIYLNVPPGHRKNWRKHCRHYNACGERVYFVSNTWYDREYVPHYQKRHGERGYDKHDRGNDRKGHDNDHNDRGSDRGNDRGNSRGNGRS